MNTATAYSYIRFSKIEQGEGDSNRRQIAVRDKFISERGLTLDDKIKLKDEGVSAHKGLHRSDKHALGRFLALVEAKQIKPGSYLLVENLDRLSREEVVEGLHLLTGLILKGITVVQLEPVVMEFKKGDGELATKLMMAVMELRRGNSESEMKSVRCEAAWREKQNQARTTKHAQTSKAPHWLKRNDTTYDVIPERAKIIQRMFAMAADGKGCYTITQTLNAEKLLPPPVQKRNQKPVQGVWALAVVGRILNSRTVLGEYQPTKDAKPFGEPVPGYYPAIIDEATFYKVQQGLDKRSVKSDGKRKPIGGRTATRINLFKGLMKNAEDGEPIHYLMKTNTKANRKSMSYYTGGNRAAEHLYQFPVDAFDLAALDCLKEVDPMDILPHHDSAEDDVMVLSGQMSEVEKQLQDIETQILGGSSVAMLVSVAAKLEAKKEDINTKLAEARQRVRNPQSEMWGACNNLIDTYYEAAKTEDAETVRTRLQSAIKDVVKEINCLFVRDGRRQFAVVQFKFHGTNIIRTVFIRHRAELMGRGFRIPRHISYGTQLDGLKGMIDITHPVHRAHVKEYVNGLLVEETWLKHFEPTLQPRRKHPPKAERAKRREDRDAKKKMVLDMNGSGKTSQEIETATGLHRTTIYRWLNA